MVYLALANRRERFLFSSLPPALRQDIKIFFGHFRGAMEQGRELLYAAGDPDEIELACEDAAFGWQDEPALYVHRRLVDRLVMKTISLSRPIRAAGANARLGRRGPSLGDVLTCRRAVSL